MSDRLLVALARARELAVSDGVSISTWVRSLVEREVGRRSVSYHSTAQTVTRTSSYLAHRYPQKALDDGVDDALAWKCERCGAWIDEYDAVSRASSCPGLLEGTEP